LFLCIAVQSKSFFYPFLHCIQDLNALTNRTSMLLQDQNDMQKNIDYLQNDVRNLLKLIKRGREENNWNLDGIQFCSIQPSDIPAPIK
jgi:hypothetical protein